MKSVIYLIIFLSFSYLGVSQIAKTQVLMASAKPNPDGTITLTWPKESYTGQFAIYRKEKFDVQDWGTVPVATVAGTENTWTDTKVKTGEAYEYLLAKVQGATTEALGFIYAGNKKTEITSMGNMILLIDSTYIIPLAQEILTLQNDLISEGWIVYTAYAGRKDSVANVKDRLKKIVDSLSGDVRTLFILGHVPVPYAGFFSANGTAPPPDGHVEGSGNHTGAWPADVFYGDFTGKWTDDWVNCTTGGATRNHNIPGDGKLDQTKLPTPVQLEVGRVDLFNMPAFKKSDTLLMKQYLNRNHLFRTGQWTAVERALISNNFTGLNLASTGYHNFSTFFPTDSIFDNRNYIQSQKKESYLWSYGCGGGSYTSCGGIGVTNDFVADTFKNVFTILAGSFFGDWDVQNSFLRAPLAAQSLACFWGGIPKWYVHHMAMGMNIGFGTKISQNNTGHYWTGGFNYSWNSVHIALIGDPTLKMKCVSPPSGLIASGSSEQVNMRWSPSPLKTDGYCIYVVDTLTNQYTRVNQNIINDTVYSGSLPVVSGRYKLALRAIKLETTASGTYYNLSGGPFAFVDYITSVAGTNNSEEVFKVYPSVAQSKIYIESNITGKIRLLDMTGRVIAESLIENNASFDVSPFASGFYFVQLQSNDGRKFNSKILKE